METNNNQYDSQDYSSDKCSGKSDTHTYYTSSRCDTTNCNDTTDCNDRSTYEKRRRRHRRRKSDCSYECGLKYADTPVGVWNLVYSCGNACTTTGTMEWLNQLLLNADRTATNHAAPDIGTNPFPCSLSPGIGVWKTNGDKKLRLDLTHIGYRCSDGAAQVYYRVHIIMKMNKRGTRTRFCGEALAYDLMDPTMCTSLDIPPISFQGHGVKVLDPGHCD